MATRAIEFDVRDGTTLRGTLHTPDQGQPPYPGVVLAHGFSGVKEQGLEAYAATFAERGAAALAYDNRCLGTSDGQPRQDIDPVAQARDFRDAVTYMQSLEPVDAERIGIWGSSYTGAQVLQIAATDRRVKAVVSQVPLISGFRNLLRLIPAEAYAPLLQQLEEERRHLFAGGTPNTIKVTSDDPTEPHAFPGATTYQYFTEKLAAENWRNEVTLRSLDWCLEFDVTPFLERISPTPLLMIVATEDTTTPTDEALKAFDLAHEPKKLLLIDGHHYRSYVENFDQTSRAAADWYLQHL